MVLRSLRRALGVGGPAVDTVLDESVTYPGVTLPGVVRLTGGQRGVAVERMATEVRVGFVTRADDLELVLDERLRIRCDRGEPVDWAAAIDRLMRQIEHN